MKYKLDKTVEIFQVSGEIPDLRQSGPAAQLVNSASVTRFNLKKIMRQCHCKL